jgi:hypothetical protein
MMYLFLSMKTIHRIGNITVSHTNKDKARLWLKNVLGIDVNTFIAGLDVLLPDRKKPKLEGDDRGYV